MEKLDRDKARDEEMSDLVVVVGLWKPKGR